MQPTKSLLDLPVKTAARWVCLGFLRKAGPAADRLHGGVDAEALHDFRVDLRRLRATLRAFRPALEDTVTRGDRKRLRKLLAATGAARDLETKVAWIDRLLAGDPVARAQCGPLRERLERARDDELSGVALRVGRRFPSFASRLERHLSHYAVQVDAAAMEAGQTTAHALGPAIAGAAAELCECLAALGRPPGAEQTHRARLAAKRLRYLVRPFETELTGGIEIVRRLGVLQTLLGDLRDLDLLAAELGDGAGVGRLARRVGMRRDEIERELVGRWLPDEAEGVLAEVERLAQELSGPGADREIERKYLLTGLPSLPAGAVELEVEQGWFGVRLPERVRCVRGADGERHFRAIKHGAGIVRIEVEEPISAGLFAALWPLTAGRRVRKRRYRVAVGELWWEIDQFTDRDLVLAEVEIPAADHPVEIPVWLERCLVREVTQEPGYLNLNLAR